MSVNKIDNSKVRYHLSCAQVRNVGSSAEQMSSSEQIKWDADSMCGDRLCIIYEFIVSTKK